MSRRGIQLALAALITVAATAWVGSFAHAATTVTVPVSAEARSFTPTAGGWTSGVSHGATCLLLLCPAGQADHLASGGSGGVGDGYLRAGFASGVGVAGDVRVTWRSPSFTAGEVDQATLSLAVRPQLGTLLSLGGAATVQMTIADVARPADSTVLADAPLASSAGFVTMARAVPAGAFVAGRQYRIELRVRVTTGIAAVQQSGSVGIDDVALQLVDRQPPSGLTAAAYTSGSVSVAGSVDPHDQPTSVTVQYGPTAAYGASSAPVVVDGSGPKAFSIPLAGLSTGATYHYRVVASNSDGTATGPDGTFTVPLVPANSPPSVLGALNARARTVVYDQVAGTTAVRVEVLGVGDAVVDTIADADPDGTVAITLPDSDGTYGVRVVRDGVAGGHSTSAAVAAVLDRVPPSIVNLALSVTPALSSDRARAVAFALPGDAASAEARVLDADGADVGAPVPAAGGAAAVQLGVVDGVYRVRVSVRDAAGNATTVTSGALVLDRTPPSAGGTPVVSGAANQRARDVRFDRAPDSATATIELVDHAGDVVAGFPVETGNSATITLPDQDGEYAVRVRQADAAGNEAVGAVTTMELDRMPPAAGGAPAVAGPSAERRRDVTFSRDPDAATAGVEVLDAAGDVVSATALPSGASATITLPDADGDYDVRLRVADAAGNEALTPLTRITLDRSAPDAGEAPLVTGATRHRAREVRFVRDPSASTVTVTVTDADGAEVLTESVPDPDERVAITLPAADGRYFVTVTQADGAGNAATSPAREIELDTTPPASGAAPTVNGAPTARSRQVSFVRAGDATLVTVELLDAAGHLLSTTPATGSPATMTLPDTDGEFRVRVRQTDAAGNDAASPATSVTLDRAAPAPGGIPVVTGPAHGRARSVGFQRASDAVDARIEVFDDAGTWLLNVDVPEGAAATITLPDVDAAYLVRVRQWNAAGNASVSPFAAVTLARSGGGGAPNPPADETPDTPDSGSASTDAGSGDGNGPAGPPAEPRVTDPGGFGGLLADCYGGSLALTDVRTAGRSVAIAGLTTYAPGTPIAIHDSHGRAVATTTAGPDGRFAAKAALPGARERGRVRYTASAGAMRSSALKLQRATTLDSVSVSGTTARLAGRIDLGNAEKRVHIRIEVRGGRGPAACKAGGKPLKLAGKVELDRHTGRYSVRVKWPEGTGRTAVRVVVSGGRRSASLFVVR